MTLRKKCFKYKVLCISPTIRGKPVILKKILFISAMPGPHWNYQVNQAGSDIDDCRRKLDYLLKGDGDSDGRAAEVFRSGNTVVEIAIKTKKDRRGGEERKRCEEDKNQWVRTPEKKLVKRTTVVERLTEAEADKRGMKWGKSLATGQIPPRYINF